MHVSLSNGLGVVLYVVARLNWECMDLVINPHPALHRAVDNFYTLGGHNR